MTIYGTSAKQTFVLTPFGSCQHMSCLKNPLINDFSKRYHLRPCCKIRGSSAEAWRKVRGSETVSGKARGSSRKRGGRFAEAIGADVNRRANRVV